MPRKKKTDVDLSEWTPEKFKDELIGANGQNLPFTEENKTALYALSREEALQLDPRIFQRWRAGVDKNFDRGGKGKERNKKKAKELKDWSVKVRTLLEDKELTATMLNRKKLPKWLNPLIEGEELPTPSEVIAATLMAKAMTGDVRAIEELRKMGFGDKVTIDAGESFFNKDAIKLEIVHPTQETKAMEKEEFGTPAEEQLNQTIQAESAPEPQVEQPKPMPEASTIPGDNIPLALQQEFDRQEQERQMPRPQPNSGVNEHGIDRGILNKVVITRNKNR